MATSARYCDLAREMKNPYSHRLRLVESARQEGIKPTAGLTGNWRAHGLLKKRHRKYLRKEDLVHFKTSMRCSSKSAPILSV
jgi:hypothetical protein